MSLVGVDAIRALELLFGKLARPTRLLFSLTEDFLRLLRTACVLFGGGTLLLGGRACTLGLRYLLLSRLGVPLRLGPARACLNARLCAAAAGSTARHQGETHDEQQHEHNDQGDDPGIHAALIPGLFAREAHGYADADVASERRVMSQFDIDTVLELRGATVRDRAGEKIGTLGDVFLDRRTERPAWAQVNTGLFGVKHTYVSLSAARVSGDEVHLPYDKETVQSAPRADPDVFLKPEEERALYRHYGEIYDNGEADAGVSGSDAAEHVDTAASADATGARPSRAGTGESSGGDAIADDDAMIRSEEEVRLGHIERRPVERVRIKKVTVTENERRMIPVRREVIQLEHEPPPSGHIESVEDIPEDERQQASER